MDELDRLLNQDTPNVTYTFDLSVPNTAARAVQLVRDKGYARLGSATIRTIGLSRGKKTTASYAMRLYFSEPFQDSEFDRMVILTDDNDQFDALRKLMQAYVGATP